MSKRKGQWLKHAKVPKQCSAPTELHKYKWVYILRPSTRVVRFNITSKSACNRYTLPLFRECLCRKTTSPIITSAPNKICRPPLRGLSRPFHPTLPRCQPSASPFPIIKFPHLRTPLPQTLFSNDDDGKAFLCPPRSSMTSPEPK